MAPFAALLAAAALAACAAPPPPPAPPPPVKEAPPPVEPEPEPEPSAEAPPAEVEATPSRGSGRTPLLKSDPDEITDSFGAPPAKLELGEGQPAVFRIPENALSQAVNLTFKIEPKGKSNGPPIGKIYRMTPVIPPASEPAKIDTSGPPFLLALPAGDKKDANLAIGQITADDKGRQKLVWTVIAPVKIDDVSATAHFELPSISDSFLHVTAKPVTAPAN